MRSSYLIFIAAFCLVFAAACGDDGGGGTGGTGGGTGGAGGGTGGTGGGGGSGGGAGPVGGEFRAFSNLLAEMDGCDTPDLSTVPGSGILEPGADIRKRCIIVTPPDISGSITLENTGTDTWDVAATQALLFQIDTTIMGLDFLQVQVTTESLTQYSGTGTGSVADGGSLTLDTLDGAGGAGGAGGSGDPEFNIDAPLTGTVACKARNILTAGQDCTANADCIPMGTPDQGQTCGLIEAGKCDPLDVSLDVCTLAMLGPAQGATCTKFPDDTTDIDEAGCFLSLPFPDDPGARLWPVLNFFDVGGELNVRMGDGSTNANGWFITNAGGTQFGTLEGPVTVE